MTLGTAHGLDVDDLERQAGTRTGDNAPPRFLPALGRLVEAINGEAGLHAAGTASARRALEQALQNQLLLAAWRRDTPPADRPLPPVAVITGLHRTGTTLLQGLLAAHPGVRAPRLWELLAPAAHRCAHRLIEAAQRYVDDYYRVAPGFAAIHPLHPLKPEECHRLLGNSFHSEIYGLRYHVPGYLDWLDRQDHTAAYHLHREQLRAILARDAGPVRSGGRPVVVLKCPFHLWHPDALATTYPGARIVRLHRDPVATIGSSCSLTHTIRSARSDRVDATEIGDFWLRRTTAAVDRLGRRDADAFAGLPVHDVRYPDLTADPVRVAREVCAFLDLPWDAEAERRVRQAAEARGPATPGAHRYHLRDYGLDPGRVSRASAAYRAAYQL